jgi:hypothetical protein
MVNYIPAKGVATKLTTVDPFPIQPLTFIGGNFERITID